MSNKWLAFHLPCEHRPPVRRWESFHLAQTQRENKWRKLKATSAERTWLPWGKYTFRYVTGALVVVVVEILKLAVVLDLITGVDRSDRRLAATRTRLTTNTFHWTSFITWLVSDTFDWPAVFHSFERLAVTDAPTKLWPSSTRHFGFSSQPTCLILLCKAQLPNESTNWQRFTAGGSFN